MSHAPVLLAEAIAALNIKPNGAYFDGTFGRGGHSSAILQQLSKSGRLLATDKDPVALQYAASQLGDGRLVLEQASFAALPEIAKKHGVFGKLDGALLDLGVSSPQLDTAERGFSFLRDGPLDMRMNPDEGISAAEFLQQVEHAELAKIFNLLNINTHDVLEAAGTKWNFLPFKPGLVGGHCIGVDPYYLAQKAQEYGYNPEIILAGRRLNDSMGKYIASEVIKLMIQKDINIKDAEILILGITFKENCPDVRNTKVVDVINALKEYNTRVTVFDPWANCDEVHREYGLTSIKEVPQKKYDSIVLTVAHNEFKNLDFEALKKNTSVIYDVKNSFEDHQKDKGL